MESQSAKNLGFIVGRQCHHCVFTFGPNKARASAAAHAAFDYRGRKRFPQFANTRQRVVQVIFEDAGPTVRFSINAHYLAFDGNGSAAPDVRGATDAVSAHYELEQAKRDVVQSRLKQTATTSSRAR
jgi:hypothetical protein